MPDQATGKIMTVQAKLSVNEVLIVRWLRKRANEWQTEEGPHEAPVIGCNCCFPCGEAVTLRIAADAIEQGDHRT